LKVPTCHGSPRISGPKVKSPAQKTSAACYAKPRAQPTFNQLGECSVSGVRRAHDLSRTWLVAASNDTTSSGSVASSPVSWRPVTMTASQRYDLQTPVALLPRTQPAVHECNLENAVLAMGPG
jgi:hypothetical protein